MGETRTVRRTFPADRLTIYDLRHLVVDAHREGLTDAAHFSTRSFYRPGRGYGWQVEVIVHGEVADGERRANLD